MIGAFFLCFWTVQPVVYLEVGGAEPGLEFGKHSLVPADIAEDDLSDYDESRKGDAMGRADAANTTLLTAAPKFDITEGMKLENLSYIGDLLRNSSVY
ncbi:hypothetical protein V5799_020306 [Amblyomma americanum]|uniref:Secreted protein n=1 Tax=Amblyomma americanum TaxID=6943 RepID=A0AAQ4EU71_AMBAM